LGLKQKCGFHWPKSLPLTDAQQGVELSIVKTNAQTDNTQIAGLEQQKSRNEFFRFGFSEKLAATYSRGIYKTTTIGKTVFDGRVRNGNGSDHSFMATKK
jgi:hypothetical protein